MIPPPPRSTRFPYTTLFRSQARPASQRIEAGVAADALGRPGEQREVVGLARMGDGVRVDHDRGRAHELVQDRKSTRLNSSHPSISYAVFCLKKKKKKCHDAK